MNTMMSGMRNLVLSMPACKAEEYYRFASAALDHEEQQRALKNLVRMYLATFSDLGIETWLMHGTLLGWWWNKQVRPVSIHG